MPSQLELLKAAVARLEHFSEENIIGKCLLEVNNQKYIDQSCNIVINKYGISVGGATESSEGLPYFAILSYTEDNKLEGYWNETPNSGHAHTSLGVMVEKEGC